MSLINVSQGLHWRKEYRDVSCSKSCWSSDVRGEKEDRVDSQVEAERRLTG